MRRLVLGSLLLLLLSLSLSAQSVRDSVTIEVVDVPVFVTRGTQPIEGLTRDDFELYVNGKRQAIDYFDVVGTAEAESAEPQTLRERRLFLVMFDLIFTPPYGIGRAQAAAAKLIENANEGDLFAIATFSSRRGVWFATPFTSDRAALARGIASLTTSDSGDPLSIVMTASERQEMSEWVMHSGNLAAGIAGDTVRELLYSPLRRAMEHQILDFSDLTRRLTALQGQKHIVLLSEGIYASRPYAMDIRQAYAPDGPPQSFRSFISHPGSTLTYLRDMHEAFQSADILLHTLDLKGVASFESNEQLYILAKGTGGEALHNRNDLGNALVDLSEAYRSGYLLGFKPVKAKRGHNTIEVKVKGLGRDAKVRHRQGFSGTMQKLDVNEGLYLADIVLNDVPQTGTAAVLDVKDGSLFVRVPLRPLAAQIGAKGTAELLVYLFDAKGTALGFTRRVVDVPADATGEKGYVVDLPEGAEVAKALLRVDGSVGFSKTEL